MQVRTGLQGDGLPEAATVRVAIPADLKHLLDLYITQCQLEISGLGTVEVVDDGLQITGLYLLEQEVTAGHTKLSTLAVAKFIAEAPERGIDPGAIRLWWHSHATLSAYWSPTDNDTIGEAFSAAPWWVSIVGNHKGEYLARLDVFSSEELTVRVTVPADLKVIHVGEKVQAVREEIGQLVSKAPEPEIGFGTLTRQLGGGLSLLGGYADLLHPDDPDEEESQDDSKNGASRGVRRTRGRKAGDRTTSRR